MVKRKRENLDKEPNKIQKTETSPSLSEDEESAYDKLLSLLASSGGDATRKVDKLLNEKPKEEKDAQDDIGLTGSTFTFETTEILQQESNENNYKIPFGSVDPYATTNMKQFKKNNSYMEYLDPNDKNYSRNQLAIDFEKKKKDVWFNVFNKPMTDQELQELGTKYVPGKFSPCPGYEELGENVMITFGRDEMPKRLPLSEYMV